MSEDGRPLGAPAPVYDLWPRRLLRFVQKQACDEAFSSDAAPDHALPGIGSRLGLVLHRRAGVGILTAATLKLLLFHIDSRWLCMDNPECSAQPSRCDQEVLPCHRPK